MPQRECCNTICLSDCLLTTIPCVPLSEGTRDRKKTRNVHASGHQRLEKARAMMDRPQKANHFSFSYPPSAHVFRFASGVQKNPPEIAFMHISFQRSVLTDAIFSSSPTPRRAGLWAVRYLASQLPRALEPAVAVATVSTNKQYNRPPAIWCHFVLFRP